MHILYSKLFQKYFQVMAIENNESRKGSQGDLDTPNIGNNS